MNKEQMLELLDIQLKDWNQTQKGGQTRKNQIQYTRDFIEANCD